MSRLFGPILTLGASLSACAPGDGGASSEPGAETRFRAHADPVADRYLVVLRDDATAGRDSVAPLARTLADRHRGSLRRVFTRAVRGFSASMSRADALSLSLDPRVLYVQEVGRVRASEIQQGATWGLDRIDQRVNPLDGTYTRRRTGAGVHAYVLDTGIRITHQEFEGRATADFDAIGDGRGALDCNGHGTHVAGTIGSRTYGVANQASLHSVRVLDCGGYGTTEEVVAGLDWVIANHQSPAVANLSLGDDRDDALDQAVAATVAAGVTVAVAAGNQDDDACEYSPARVPQVLTVGVTDERDARISGFAWGSNWGPCVDLFAPGVHVLSSYHRSDTSITTMGGTSMASPHVAGAAALILEERPEASPAEIALALTGMATRGVVSGLRDGSPDRFLYAGFIGAGLDPIPPEVELLSPGAGDQLVGTVTVSADASDETALSLVELAVDDRPLGRLAGAPYALSWDTDTVDPGDHVLVARALDSAGNVTSSAEVPIRVGGPGVEAAYDPALGAPLCDTIAARCESGALIDGRGPLGPEPHAPNTLGGTCQDGDLGRYHFNGSVDRLRIWTADGTDLAPGKTVRIAATIWTYPNFADNHVDFYAAPDADAPVWTLLGTVEPTAIGPHTVQLEQVLPEGGGPRQAVRAVIRYMSTRATCSTGRYDDHDDLAFAVGEPAGAQ